MYFVKWYTFFMKNKIIKSFLLLFFILLTGSVQAQDVDHVTAALDKYAERNASVTSPADIEAPNDQHSSALPAVSAETVNSSVIQHVPKPVVWVDSVVDPAKARSVQPAQAEASSAELFSESAYGRVAVPQKNTFARPKHEFKAGIERYTYRYNEVVNGGHFMHTRGYFKGYYGAYTFRPVDMDIMYKAMVDVFRLELRYATGKDDYDGSNIFKGMKDYTYEVRGVLGKDLNIGHDVRVMPYVGVATRYLNNGLQANQPGGYNRESRYFYVPVGLESHLGLPHTLGLVSTLEYDYFIGGRQISHAEDVKDGSGTSVGYDTNNNVQRKGFGLRADLSVVKELLHTRVSFGPFYRYWKIEDSNTVLETKHGIATGLIVTEPANVTREFGLKMDVAF